MSKTKRDISLARLDESYKNSVAYQYGLFAEKFTYDMLPKKVVEFAKNILLDSIGAMISALNCQGFAYLSKSIESWGGTKEVTVLGTSLKTSASNAALANIFLVHALGYNDLEGGGHNSDAMPAILAVAERKNASGKDFLTSMIRSYELGRRFTDAVGGIFGYAPKGFPFDIRGGISIPPCLSQLLHFTWMRGRSPMQSASVPPTAFLWASWTPTTRKTSMPKIYGWAL